MLDYQKTRNFQFGDMRHTYTSKDAILYALGLGMGSDPLDRNELPFVYEREQKVVPTMASTLAAPGFWMRDHPELGIDALKVVHGEQAIAFHNVLPPAATVIGRTRVTRIVDKGEGKGATLHTEKKIFLEGDETPIATVEQVTFCRGDGGFSRNGGGDEAPPAPAATPETPPEVVVDCRTAPQCALLYRLNGDLNPLHADPDVAIKAGFERPILHGLATYGIACRAVLARCCDYDPRRLKSLRARMSSPVFPGETIRIEGWRTHDGVALRARVVERGVVVLSHGHASIAEA